MSNTIVVTSPMRCEAVNTFRVSMHCTPVQRRAILTGVIHTPGDLGGRARLLGYHIPVWVILALMLKGATKADIRAAYPALWESSLTDAFRYIAFNYAEILKDVRDNEEQV